MQPANRKINGDTLVEYYLSKTDGGKNEKAKNKIGRQIVSLFPPPSTRKKVLRSCFIAIATIICLLAAYVFFRQGIENHDAMLLLLGCIALLACFCIVNLLFTLGQASIYDMLCIYKEKHGSLPNATEATEIININKGKVAEIRILEREFSARS